MINVLTTSKFSKIIMDLAQNDYVEVYLYVHTYTSTVSGGQNSNIFQGFKLIS